MCFSERLADQCVVLRFAELEQCPLHRFFMRVAGNVDRFHRPGIQAGIEHAGAECTGRGIEVLYLLRHMIDIPQVFGQLNGTFEVAAGM